VQPVLAGLVLRYAHEQQIGHHAVFAAARGRLDRHFVLVVMSSAPAEHTLPERRERRRVGGVNTQALDADRHGDTLSLPGTGIQPTIGCRDRAMSKGRGEQAAGLVHARSDRCP